MSVQAPPSPLAASPFPQIAAPPSLLESVITSIPPDPLLSLLSFPDLCSLSMVSVTCHAEVRAFRLHAFKLENVLVDFFALSDVPSFLELLSLSGCIVGGSVASKFFSRDVYDSNLDLFCALTWCGIVGSWLEEHGFLFRPTSKQHAPFSSDYSCILTRSPSSPSSSTTSSRSSSPSYDSAEIVQVWSFSASDGSRPVQLMATIHSPVASILSFHSTCVLNFFNHWTAYSLYPWLTFWESVNISLYADGAPSPSVTTAIQKWSVRGFPAVPHPPLDRVLSATSDVSLSSMRWVGDRHCWVVHFGFALGLHPPPDDVCTNSWKIHYGRYRAKLLHAPLFSFAPSSTGSPSIFCVSPDKNSSLHSILSHFHSAVLHSSTLLSCLSKFRFPGHTSDHRALSFTQRIFSVFEHDSPPHLASPSVAQQLYSFFLLLLSNQLPACLIESGIFWQRLGDVSPSLEVVLRLPYDLNQRIDYRELRRRLDYLEWCSVYITLRAPV
ncbi:hypothetical protein GYMLUDRAFT_245719 [Collybiopsis luxurians FD-317 M1]|uniref:Uncharacterized protein n=1 Tax=Collybiopsis luxurians FD-317 M1 TaxID=944289 RepID=A0A0D0B6C1_9AGAR|nr:hypothetical protein GYMLUDRAFT_245719 [Collybiopsis luxurians FD-317 M1]